MSHPVYIYRLDTPVVPICVSSKKKLCNWNPLLPPPSFVIVKKNQQNKISWVVDQLVLPQMGYTDRREVKQFQFTAWPDHGVPEHSAPFLQFIRRWGWCWPMMTMGMVVMVIFLRIHMLNPTDSGPIVTHCRWWLWWSWWWWWWW